MRKVLDQNGVDVQPNSHAPDEEVKTWIMRWKPARTPCCSTLIDDEFDEALPIGIIDVERLNMDAAYR